MTMEAEPKRSLIMVIVEGTPIETACRAASIIASSEHRTVHFRVGNRTVTIQEAEARRTLMEHSVPIPH